MNKKSLKMNGEIIMGVWEKMKKFVRVILLILLVLISLPQNVYAQEFNEPRLDILITTDKENYSVGDDIKYTIKLINKSNFIAKNINIKYELPETIKIGNNNLSENIKIMPINDVKEYSIYGQVIQNGNHTINVSVDHEVANTSDNSDYGFMLGTLLISGALLILIIKTKNKKKRVKVLLVFILTGSILTSTFGSVLAEEVEYKQQSYSVEKEFMINNQKNIMKFSYTADFISQGNGEIKLDQKLNEDDIYISKEEQVYLSGSAYDPDGIAKIEYHIDDMSGNKQDGNIPISNKWKVSLEIDDGTALMQLVLTDKLGGTTYLNFKIAKLSDEIQLSENTYVLSDKEVSDFEDAYVDCVLFDNKTPEDTTDDGMYIVLDKGKQFTKNIISKESNPNIGDIIYITPNNKITNGLTSKIIDIINPSSVEFNERYTELNEINNLDDNNYVVIKLVTPTYQELIKKDCLIYSENETMKSDNILFFNLPDGTNILDKSNNQYSRSTRSNDGLISILPSITLGNDGFQLSYDNVLYDADDDPKTEADQLRFKASIKMDHFSIVKSVFEYKIEDIIPREMGFDFDYDYDFDAKLTLGGSINTKNLVKKINNKFQKASIATEEPSLNKVWSFGNYHLSGVKMDKEIYLGCIGIQLGTGITTFGTFGNQQRRSAAPIIMINFVIDLEGELKATASYVSNYHTYNVESFRVEKKNFNGLFGKLDEAKNYLTGNILGLYDYHFGAKSYKSRIDKKSEPVLKKSFKLNGEMDVSLGAGANVGIMWLGIQPATIGVSVGAEMNGKANINADFVNGKVTENEIDGKLSLKAGLYAKAALRLMIENSKEGSKQKFGFDWYKKWWLFSPINKEFSFSNKTDINLNVYDNEKDKNLIKESKYIVELEKDNKKTTSDLSTGKCNFKNMVVGEYKIRVYDDENKLIYSNEINITKDFKIIDIYLEIKDVNLPTIGKGDYKIKRKPNTISGVNLEAIEDSVVSYYIDNIDSENTQYKINIKKGQVLPAFDLLEITIHSGQFKFVVWGDDKLNEIISISNLAHEAVYGFTLNAGEKLTVDNQKYNGDINYNRTTFWGKTSSTASGKEIFTDYWWNKYIGWEVNTTEYEIKPKMEFWCPLYSYKKREYQLTSGSMDIYIRYEIKDNLVFY